MSADIAKRQEAAAFALADLAGRGLPVCRWQISEDTGTLVGVHQPSRSTPVERVGAVRVWADLVGADPVWEPWGQTPGGWYLVRCRHLEARVEVRTWLLTGPEGGTAVSGRIPRPVDVDPAALQRGHIVRVTGPDVPAERAVYGVVRGTRRYPSGSWRIRWDAAGGAGSSGPGTGIVHLRRGEPAPCIRRADWRRPAGS
ncbi:hypothetical protein ACFOWE_17925 [Planomonospora corallina]|uniref:Uncharacterized protein n=1 Tax=Planomonospora corallina TaxID=1806052 RepID=A0ABV8I7K0_9ACTN